jgi:hypothetical protein
MIGEAIKKTCCVPWSHNTQCENASKREKVHTRALRY